MDDAPSASESRRVADICSEEKSGNPGPLVVSRSDSADDLGHLRLLLAAANREVGGVRAGIKAGGD